MLASFGKPLISMLLGRYKTRISTLACDWGGSLEYGSRYVNERGVHELNLQGWRRCRPTGGDDDPS